MNGTNRLVTKSYCSILAANFLLHFAFYLLLPILPFYLMEVFGTEEGSVGVVLSLYTVATLTIRPFSGYLLDTLSRKPLYLVAFILFAAVFGGYILAGTIALFMVMRVVHGVSFGMVTVAGNTLSYRYNALFINLSPNNKRGTATSTYLTSWDIGIGIGLITGGYIAQISSLNNAYLLGGFLVVISAIFFTIKAAPHFNRNKLR